ncbi:MAG TPA: hypothetical protein VN367_00560 [Chlorobaculum sp.]|nr:hypothetical protein [Chlorobaculum sp.]
MVLRYSLTVTAALQSLCCVAFLLSAAPAHAETIADCNAIHSGPCTKQSAGRTVVLEINPRPVRHMAELTFSVTVTPGTAIPSTLALDLSMPGMYMGKNQVVLQRKSTCTWEGKGVIVRCMSGRKLWKATIVSADLGNPSFIFEVRD